MVKDEYYLKGRLKFLLILRRHPAVHLLNFDLFASPRLVELLLEDGVLELVLLLHRLQLVLQVDSFQCLVLQVLLCVCQLASHLVVVRFDCFQIFRQSRKW